MVLYLHIVAFPILIIHFFKLYLFAHTVYCLYCVFAAFVYACICSCCDTDSSLFLSCRCAMIISVTAKINIIAMCMRICDSLHVTPTSLLWESKRWVFTSLITMFVWTPWHTFFIIRKNHSSRHALWSIYASGSCLLVSCSQCLHHLLQLYFSVSETMDEMDTV